ncbi:hypothetical protein [Streptomyces sp. NPDC002078]
MHLVDEFARNGAPRVRVWLERHGIVFTAVGIVLGIASLGALTRPWGQARWVHLRLRQGGACARLSA